MEENKNKKMMLRKVNVLGFLENKRYEDSRLRSAFNASRTSLSANDRLLTLFLLSLSNRQMGIRRLKDVGGFVFSDIAYRFGLQGLTADDYMHFGSETSCFLRSFQNGKGEGEYGFVSMNSPNKTLTMHYPEYSSLDECALFQTRFPVDDGLCMLWSLTLLQELYDRSFVKFLSSLMEMEKNDKRVMVRNLAYGLYLFVTPNEEVESFLEVDPDFALARIEEVKGILSDKGTFQKNAKEYSCIGRQDKRKMVETFLSSLKEGAPFHSILLEALMDAQVDSSLLEALTSRDTFIAFVEMENGDTTGGIFLECITKTNDDSTWNEVLSNPFLTSRVNAMCRNSTCSICPFEAVTDKKALEDIRMVCVSDKMKYCTVMKIFAGYLAPCDGEDCSLRKTLGF